MSGFTIIELMVTIFVAALFVGAFVTLTTTYNYFMAQARQNSVADNLAYTYIQKYTRPDYTSIAWFICDEDENDVVVNPNAKGSVIDQGTLDGDSVNLPNPVTYNVTALAPYGCSDENVANPVQVDVTVTYGLNNKTVRHVVYTKGAN